MSEQHSTGRAARIEIGRKGLEVHFVMRCASEDEAKMLFERAATELGEGYLKLEVRSDGVVN